MLCIYLWRAQPHHLRASRLPFSSFFPAAGRFTPESGRTRLPLLQALGIEVLLTDVLMFVIISVTGRDGHPGRWPARRDRHWWVAP